MKKSLIHFLFIISLVCFVGCGGEGLNNYSSLTFENVKEMVANAKSGIIQVSLQDFKASIENEEEFILIDVREADEFEANCIPGAFNIPRGFLEFKIASEDFWDMMGMYVPEKTEEIIIYCKKGGRGVLATESLTRLGYENVKNIIGGWEAWEMWPEVWEEKEEKKDEGGCG